MLQIIGLALKIADGKYQDRGFQQELQAANIKISNSKKEIEDAMNFQITNSELFSSLFQGDHTKEVQIRQLQQLKQQGFKNAKAFMEWQNFEKQIDFQQLKINFQNAQVQYYDIDLELMKISQDIFFLDQTDVNDKLFQLNQGIDDICSLLLLYFQGLYAKERAINWFDSHGEEILDYIYLIVKERAKSVQSQQYNILLKKINNYCLAQQQNNQLKLLCQTILERKYDLKEISLLVQQHFDQTNQQLRISAELLYGFQLTNVILSIHQKTIYDFHNKEIVECLQIYQIPQNQEQDGFIYHFLELNFYDYLSTHKFLGGITDKIVAQHISFLIFSGNWEINESLAEPVDYLLDYLSCSRKSQQQSRIKLSNQEDCSITSRQIQFSQENSIRKKEAQEWWNFDLNDQNRVRIIFQIYSILAKINFVQDQLQIGIYSPIARLTLIEILRIFSNHQQLKYYLQLLHFCEIITHKIQLQIIQQFQERLNNQSKNSLNIFDLPVNISLASQNFQVIICQFEQMKTFWLRESQFYNILKPISNDGVLDSQLSELQYNSISRAMEQISKKIGNQNEQPKLNFEVISKQKTNSNVLTLFISGFLTEYHNKGKDWSQLLQQGSGTVIAMHWKSLCFMDLFQFLGQLAGQIDQNVDYFKTVMEIGVKGFSRNTYDEANQEAKKAGIYLGYLLADHNLFGGRVINIIVHSLGSVVLSHCIKTLDKLYEKTQNKFINDILIMGGVEDVNKLAKLRWNLVAGRVFNVSSQNDQILSKILCLTQLEVKPCGLNKVPFIFKQVINLDMTYLINGHTDYKNQLKTIFWLLGFNNDHLQFNIKIQ